jgi:methyl-accepting chemotaxis protein
LGTSRISANKVLDFHPSNPAKRAGLSGKDAQMFWRKKPSVAEAIENNSGIQSVGSIPIGSTSSQGADLNFQAMLEELPINVMTCRLDDFTIDYANKATLKTLKEIEHALPIKAASLVGTCIDIFHKNPKHQQGMLRDPSNLPHSARITIGGEILDLLVTAITDARGNYVAPMVTWSVVTAQVAVADRVTEVVEAVREDGAAIEKDTKALQASSEETKALSTEVASAAEQASSNVQTVASASEELSASISEVASQVSQTNDVVVHGSNRASDVGKSVETLNKAAQEIGAVVSMISDIAGQTNLLALNATIEAARAGEAGKGFAVVANEVKALASQTASATENITVQIQGIQSVVEEVVDGIAAVSKTIEEITVASTAISGAIEQQTAATREISENANQAATVVQQVASSMTKVLESAESAGEIGDGIATRVGALTPKAEQLRSDLDAFLNR